MSEVFFSGRETGLKTLPQMNVTFFSFFYSCYAICGNCNAFSSPIVWMKIYELFNCMFQKQPPRGVPRKMCSENMQQIYRRTPSLKKTSGWLLDVSTYYAVMRYVSIQNWEVIYVNMCVSMLNDFYNNLMQWGFCFSLTSFFII